MPFLASVSARQGGFVLANAGKLPEPTFSAFTKASGGYTFTITNYNPTVTYSFSVEYGGSASQTSGNVTVTGLANGINARCYVTVNKNGWLTNSSSILGETLSQLSAPTLGPSTGTSGGYTFSITDYFASNTYSFSVTNGGSATHVSGAVTVTGIGDGITATCTVTSSRSGYLSNSTNTTGTSFSKLDTPTLSTATGTYGGFTFTITNYDAENTYAIGTSAGSVSRTGGTVTQSGLANGGTATVTVSSSQSGFVASDSATRAGTAIASCSNTGYSFTTTEGGNCGSCGNAACGAGHVPAYDILHIQVSPVPCMSGTTVVTGGYVYNIGSWYCKNVGLTCCVAPCPAC